jgi:hypothetical protein
VDAEVFVKAEGLAIGQYYKVRITAAGDYDLFAVISA